MKHKNLVHSKNLLISLIGLVILLAYNNCGGGFESHSSSDSTQSQSVANSNTESSSTETAPAGNSINIIIKLQPQGTKNSAEEVIEYEIENLTMNDKVTCRLNDINHQNCDSPINLSSLKEGQQKFELIVNNNNCQSCSKLIEWTVDLTEVIEPKDPVSNDPKEKLLSSSSRIGFGAKTTGGSQYVYVKNFNELKSAISQDGNYVILDPSLAGQQMGFTSIVYPANNITLDGSLAPGLVMYPDYEAGYPYNNYMFNNTGIGGQGNKIFHSVKLDGRRSGKYNSNRQTGAFAINKGLNYWIDHVEITGFWDDAIAMGFNQTGSADYITVSNNKIHNTGKALYGWYQTKLNHGQGHITAFFNELNADERNPNSRGAEHFHFFNNWVHDWRWEAVVSGGLGVTNYPEQAGNRTIDSRMLSQSNVFEAPDSAFQCSERADPAPGLAYGGWIYIDGKSIYNGVPTCGDSRRINENSNTGPGKPQITYTYKILPANQVKAYIQKNVGPLK